MTAQDKDPFERLSQIATPEPDPAKIGAVAAMSARAFAAQSGRAPESKGGPFTRWFGGTHWLMPASAMALTVFAAALIVPLIGRQDMLSPSPSDAMLSREAAVAEVEPPAVVADQAMPAPQEGTRMGAVPSAPRQGLPLDLRDDVTVEAYSFDGVDIVVRSAADEVALYTMEGTFERPFDQRVKAPSETVELTDAFRRTTSEGEVLFVRSGLGGGQQQWDAFVDSGTGFALSGALSLLVHDAVDRAEVLARLDATDAQ
ncbi:hypothetical protein [Pelagibacterium lacus]|uniref:DUF4367 domain-containing protein n=1 Tax=Pelagibacterium lacus TaxID=2282655 RepID=A0A369W322_9HYPH|nr:hypothetical protein [Pelagibacterium lacus]RDE07672.1 hypothetical protein DVH29_15435 [Pelagibacterium lacus]